MSTPSGSGRQVSNHISPVHSTGGKYTDNGGFLRDHQVVLLVSAGRVG